MKLVNDLIRRCEKVYEIIVPMIVTIITYASSNIIIIRYKGARTHANGRCYGLLFPAHYKIWDCFIDSLLLMETNGARESRAISVRLI